MFFTNKELYKKILKKISDLEEQTYIAYDDNDFKLDILIRSQEIMTKQLEALKAKVAEQVQVTASAITLIEGIAASLKAVKDDPVALAALADELDKSVDALAEAVAENTEKPDVSTGGF